MDNSTWRARVTCLHCTSYQGVHASPTCTAHNAQACTRYLPVLYAIPRSARVTCMHSHVVLADEFWSPVKIVNRPVSIATDIKEHWTIRCGQFTIIGKLSKAGLLRSRTVAIKLRPNSLRIVAQSSKWNVKTVFRRFTVLIPSQITEHFGRRHITAIRPTKGVIYSYIF